MSEPTTGYGHFLETLVEFFSWMDSLAIKTCDDLQRRLAKIRGKR
jgi:hypothetical protein